MNNSIDIPQLKYHNIHFNRNDENKRYTAFQAVFSLSSTSKYFHNFC